jgi:type VI secretion system protein ImpA
MKATVDSLLEPISPDNPCGEDIGYDPLFVELDTMLQGKPETQFAAAEEPDWRGVTERCLELFQRSKDLRVAVRLALGWLKLNGLPGFRDGLLVIKGLVENYWEPFYPRLDPDDGNDPLERVNILSSLATPLSTYGDPLKVIARVREAPISDSPQMGRISIVDVERSAAGSSENGGQVFTAAQIQGALRSTPPPKMAEIYEAVVGALGAVKTIDDLLTRQVGSSQAVAFDPLEEVLKEIHKTLAPHVPPREGVEPAGEASTGAEDTASGDGSAISGSIRSRQDVVRVIDQICEFYHRTEPSSPVPLILQRARRLVDMDFVQLLADLAPDSLGQISMIAGIRPDNSAVSEAPAE